MSNEQTAGKKQRLFALDVFRGFTIIGMIIVNSPNTSGQLSHAYWDGLMLADMVFPFFIFVVGVAISLGLKNFDPENDNRGEIIKKMLRRTIILFILGLGVNLLYTEFSAIRILGVLQRIALVYLITSLMALYFSERQIIYSSAFILVSYWLFILFIPAPGLEVGTLLRGENIINWFDQFLPGMLWRGTWDPEGILSTYPAIVSGTMGLIAGNLIVKNKNDLMQMVVSLFVFGFACFSVGYVWSFFFPIIKQVWTSTFVLVTGGLAAMILAIMLWYTDIKGARKGTYACMVFGTNAITAYVLHVALEKGFDAKLGENSIHGMYINFAELLGLNDVVSSAVWITIFVTLCFIPIWILYKRKIIIKI